MSKARATGDTRALTQRHIQVGDDAAACTAFLRAQCEVAHQLSAGAHTPPAQDAAVMIQDKIWVRGINRKIFPIRLQRPVIHTFGQGRVLKITLASTDLTIHTKMISFAEDQG